MNEIEKRIATVWPGRPTTADVEATRIADLRAIKAEIGAVAAWTDGMHARLDALAARVSALETASAKCPSAPMPHEGAPMTHKDIDFERLAKIRERNMPPSPAAPLVERMAEAMFMALSRRDDREETRISAAARAALRVAAEGLLVSITPYEWKTAAYDADVVLRARLAAALEACR